MARRSPTTEAHGHRRAARHTPPSASPAPSPTCLNYRTYVRHSSCVLHKGGGDAPGWGFGCLPDAQDDDPGVPLLVALRRAVSAGFHGDALETTTPLLADHAPERPDGDDEVRRADQHQDDAEEDDPVGAAHRHEGDADGQDCRAHTGE